MMGNVLCHPLVSKTLANWENCCGRIGSKMTISGFRSPILALVGQRGNYNKDRPHCQVIHSKRTGLHHAMSLKSLATISPVTQPQALLWRPHAVQLS